MESKNKDLEVKIKEASENTPTSSSENSEDSSSDAPPAKRVKLDNVCVSCLGVLQEETWPESFTMVQEVLDKKWLELSLTSVCY